MDGLEFAPMHAARWPLLMTRVPPWVWNLNNQQFLHRVAVWRVSDNLPLTAFSTADIM